jgi:F0F1-type ATP synthase membrane subunit b/b'
MEAFYYFFTRLALWNIVLATLAFLFGLLMGYWMWGQFKKRLQETGQSLLDTEREKETLQSELKDWRGKRNFTLAEKREEDERIASELKAARELAGDEKGRLQEAERKLKTQEQRVSKLQSELAKAQNKGEE